jgi:hypothetical protein
MSSLYLTHLKPGHVRLRCGGWHDHIMSLPQAQRLIGEPCWQCRAPIVAIEHGPMLEGESELSVPRENLTAWVTRA